MNKRFKYDLAQQFREKCICMSAWADKHKISRELLMQISAGKRVGKRKSQTRDIMQLLKREGFTLPDKAA
jgi:hypothetical protein